MYWLGDENDSWFEKKQTVSPLLFIFSVVTIFFLFQIHLFILWQNSRIVVSKLKVLFTNSLLNSIRSQLLAFPLLL